MPDHIQLSKLTVDIYHEASIWHSDGSREVEIVYPFAQPSIYQKVSLRRFDVELRCWSQNPSGQVSKELEFEKKFKKIVAYQVPPHFFTFDIC